MIPTMNESIIPGNLFDDIISNCPLTTNPTTFTSPLLITVNQVFDVALLKETIGFQFYLFGYTG
jgi:hypothetical protein